MHLESQYTLRIKTFVCDYNISTTSTNFRKWAIFFANFNLNGQVYLYIYIFSLFTGLLLKSYFIFLYQIENKKGFAFQLYQIIDLNKIIHSFFLIFNFVSKILCYDMSTFL